MTLSDAVTLTAAQTPALTALTAELTVELTALTATLTVVAREQVAGTATMTAPVCECKCHSPRAADSCQLQRSCAQSKRGMHRCLRR